MKVLHVRLDAPNFSSESIENGFIENGFGYLGLRWQEMRFNMGTELMRDQVLKNAKEYSPDVIFMHVQNPDGFTLQNYIDLQSIAKVVAFTFDVRSKEKTQWMYDIAPHIYHTVFSCVEDVKNCYDLGIQTASNVLPSCDMDVYKRYPGFKVNDSQVSFIGSNFISTNLYFDMMQERVDMVKMLQDNYGENFRLGGMGWEGAKLANAQVEVNLYNESAIAVSQNNFDREEYTSDRMFRVMSCGCFCLTKYFKGIENHFKKGIHLDWWHTIEELKLKIDYWLENSEERNIIANAGMNLVRENHRWADRVKQIQKILP